MKAQSRFLYLYLSTFVTIAGAVALIAISYLLTYKTFSSQIVLESQKNKIPAEDSLPQDMQEQPNNTTTLLEGYSYEDSQEYTGPVRHIFFHSLIIYPKKALADVKNAGGYKDNMITTNQFKQILQQLYDNDFMLIDSRLLYSFGQNGNIYQNTLYLPKSKKPLILSIDDLNYYSYMKDGGFANKLVLENDIVMTEVLTPDGNKVLTADGDIVPIVDEFVSNHSDFSLNGAKGIIGLTGFEGILGYRTQLAGTQGDAERKSAMLVVHALKKSGWIFANHSFSHERKFFDDNTSLDISRWINRVEPLVGQTNIFIGPFGQIFSDGDPRRKALVDSGFNVLYGVGMDGYTKFFDNYMAMNRINIDGYRLKNNARAIKELLGISIDTPFQ